MTSDLSQRNHIRIPAGHGDEMDAWLYLPVGPGPHPVVVMAHGIGGVKAAGLAPFAERFADDGFSALVFDYRHWGDSTGQPRQLLSVRRQLEDYHTALAWAREQDRLDATRIFVWGTSFAGMHIVELAASEADLVGSALGREPHYLQVSVPPGEFGVIATDDAMTGHARLNPGDGSWPNDITARPILDVTMHRPLRRGRRARCPLLMVVAEHDTMAPTRPALRVAAQAPRGELYRSRGGHYDVYAGGLDHNNVVQVELEFLRRHSTAGGW
jgi:uncharacterized protein